MHCNPDIVVATPGRLLHVVVEMDLQLSTVEYVVFDEADRCGEERERERERDERERKTERERERERKGLE